MSALTEAQKAVFRAGVAELVQAAMASGAAWMPHLMESGELRAGDYTTLLETVYKRPAESFMENRGCFALDHMFADAAVVS